MKKKGLLKRTMCILAAAAVTLSAGGLAALAAEDNVQGIAGAAAIEAGTEPAADTIEAGAEPAADTIEADTEPAGNTVETGTEPAGDTVEADAEPAGDTAGNPASAESADAPAADTAETGPEDAEIPAAIAAEDNVYQAEEDGESEEDFEETGLFGCFAEDSNGTVVNSWLDNTTGMYYLFLTNACSIPEVTVNITGIRMKKASAGTFDSASNSVAGAFAKTGDAITLTARDGSKYNVTVLQSGLPSVSITLNGTDLATVHANGKDAKYSGNTVVITDESGNVNVTDKKMQFKGRGNTTWDIPEKRGYQIKLDKKQSVLGMAKAKKWVLLANAFDDSMIRNQIAFYMAENLNMAFTPDARNVDLWINGEYRGLYTIGEKVEIDSSRVNLADPYGVIAELDSFFYRQEAYWFYDDPMARYFALQEAVDEDTEGVAAAGMEMFHSKLDQFCRYLNSTPASQVTLSGLGRYIDVDSFVKWYLVHEYTSNVEANGTSWFWYMDGSNDVIHVGPIWDFDSCLGNYTNYSSTSLMFFRQNIWIYTKLFQIPAFVSRFNSMFAENRGMISGLGRFASDLGASLNYAAQLNYIRWKYLGQKNPKGMLPYAPTYPQAIAQLVTWLNARYSAFGANLPSVPQADLSCSTSASGKTLKITAENVIGTSSIRAAVWSRTNDQDDLKWYDLTKTGSNTMSRVVDLTSHGGSDTYYVHIYSGGTFMKGFTLSVNMSSAEPVLSAEYDDTADIVRIRMTGGDDYSKVRFAVWSAVNDQDDLKWYDASVGSGGTASYDVNVQNHKGTGKYNIHVYGTSYSTGKQAFITAGTVTVTAPAEPEVQAAKAEGSNELRVSVSNASRYTNIRAAVWGAENDQNDLKWYNMAASKTAGSFTVSCDLAAHGETGKYHIHVYGSRGSRENVFLGSVDITVDELKRPELECRLSDSNRVLHATLDAPEKYTSVRMAVWSAKNDQDDLKWYDAQKNADGTWTAAVNISVHKDTGKYNIHVYGMKNGKNTFIMGTSFQVKTLAKPVITTAQKNGLIAVTAANADDCTGMRFAVWTAVNDQDDIVWYDAARYSDGTWRFPVNTRNHGGNGDYIIHAYGVRNGKDTFLGSAACTVDFFEPAQISVENAGEGTSQFTVTVQDSFGYSEMRAAIWGAENSQNDIVWYTMQKNGDAAYTYTCNPANHGETGKYYIHVYGMFSGKLTYLGAVSVSVEELDPPVLSVTDKGASFTVSCTNAGSFKKVRFAVWSPENGQDDIVWYDASKSADGTWSCTVNKAKHGGSSDYYIHIYGMKDDKNTFIMGERAAV